MSKPTKKQKGNFARRFSMDDWGFLCSNADFCEALESSLEEAEVTAHRILNNSSTKIMSNEPTAILTEAGQLRIWQSSITGFRWATPNGSEGISSTFDIAIADAMDAEGLIASEYGY